MRNLGLSANQVLHIPGAGDFQIKQMQVLDQPAAYGTTRKENPRDNANSASAMEVTAAEQYILPDMEQQEPLVRENEADDLFGEQTWPTDKVPCLLSAADSMKLSCTRAGISDPIVFMRMVHDSSDHDTDQPENVCA